MRIERSHDVGSALFECFATDPELLSRWHIAAGSGLEGCVERTLRDVDAFDPSFRFYRAYEGDELVGYWGVEFGNYINLIFVKPTYRTREFMPRFWRELEATVADPFFTAVYAKNEPATRFYARQGEIFKTTEHEGHGIVVFRFGKKEFDVCR